MRILHLTSHLNVGGISSYVLALSTALRERGHEVAIASGGGSLVPDATLAGLACWDVPLHTSIELSPQIFSATHQLTQRLREEPVELLHAHTRVSQVVADRLARRLRIPYVTTWHGFYRPNPGRRLWPCTGARTIAISEPVREHLVSVFGVPPERIRVIPHGIDPRPFETGADPVEKQQWRDHFGLPGAPARLVGTVARLVKSKGVDQLLRALPTIRAAVPTAHLVVVGDGEDRPHLEAMADQLGICDAVHFTGALTDTHPIFSLLEVFVFLPAEQEGFGLALLEAMASGRPIVSVRRGGGSTWLLEESGVGLVVEPGDHVALGAAMVRLLQDGELACRAAGKARQVLRERYTLARMVNEVEDVYQEVVARRSYLVKREA